MYFEFFESLHPESSSSNIWNKYDPATMNGPVLMEGGLKKHSKETDDTLSIRHFILQKDWLLYKKSKDTEAVSSAMRITYARLVLPGTDEVDNTPAEMIKDKFALKVCSRKRYSLLYALDEEQYKQWIAAFTKVMIRTDFHIRFSVSKIIGSGAFANVYEATEKTSNKLFAVKGFNKHFLEQESKGKLSLWNEISVLRIMQHANLLRLHEVHESKNSVYLVFDIYQGGELCKFLENKSGIAEEDAVNILQGLLRGVEFIASKDFVHRDLKPNNIMLKRTKNITADDVVIVDFGLAESIHEKNMIYKRCGTPGYIAPEIIGAKNVEESFTVTTKCDMFSIGVILFFMLTGKNPFEKPNYNVDTIIKKNLECKVEWPDAQLAKYSKDLVKLLKTMITFDPVHRISAKIALTSPIFKSESTDGELGDDIDEFGSKNPSLRGSVHESIQSLSMRSPKMKGQFEKMSNDSIAVNSKGNIKQDKGDGAKAKTPASNLYKQSLMKGAGQRSNASSRGSSLNRADQSHRQSCGQSFDSDHTDSDEDSDGQKDPLKSPDNNKNRRSSFAPNGIQLNATPVGPSPFAVRSSSKPREK